MNHTLATAAAWGLPGTAAFVPVLDTNLDVPVRTAAQLPAWRGRPFSPPPRAPAWACCLSSGPPGLPRAPGGAAIMLRGGERLITRYRSGGRLAVSIDDAARGTSLINALIAERVEP
ncbi:hypothetical protein E1267_37075 [Nonomuraea longispora]|uniref:Uncharacterized protein n=1 Tax=Nonomuraea longispora TaxID=1848320 RepID=A0A4R4MYL9_9ACTN|nr:hypothetical protein [Nonomuraea longispora]TDB99619.1 hypothetical protein E1267_37075 [Nonomuraea longispora]